MLLYIRANICSNKSRHLNKPCTRGNTSPMCSEPNRETGERSFVSNNNMHDVETMILNCVCSRTVPPYSSSSTLSSLAHHRYTHTCTRALSLRRLIYASNRYAARARRPGRRFQNSTGKTRFRCDSRCMHMHLVARHFWSLFFDNNHEQYHKQ